MNLVRMICVATALIVSGATAQEGGKPAATTTISLGTATPGGGFPLYGNALAAVIHDADPALSIEPRNTKGSNENIPLLERGQLDIALVAGEPAYQAFMGIGRPRTSAKILAAMYSTAGMFVVRADSPYKTIRDLVGKPVVFGAQRLRHSDPVALRAGWARLAAGPGFSIHLSRPGCRWRADGARWTCGGVVGRRHRLARIYRRGGKPRRRQVHRPRRRRDRGDQGQTWFLKPLAVPAGSYPNQTKAIDALGSWSFILARADLDDGVAYRLARALHGAESAFCGRLAQACETTAANTIAAAPISNSFIPAC